MIVNKIAEATAKYISDTDSRPSRLLINSEDLTALMHERPEAFKEGSIWGLRIEMQPTGCPLTVDK